MTPKNRRFPRRQLASVALGLAILPAAVCRGEVVSWDRPDLDTWVYPNAFVGSGTRVFAPSFGTGLSVDPETSQLSRGQATRLGNFVFAFETTDQLDAGLDPSRYVVNSATVTATFERGQGGPNNGLFYRSQPQTPASVLADVAAGQYGESIPIEMFGVGFAGGVDGFALGVDLSGDRFAESDEGWQGGNYTLFPLDVASGADATNNVNGGFSATDPSGQTDPFAATTLAIGLVPGASDGDVLPQDTTFEFALDLTNDAIEDYVQTGLSSGVVGFAISSLQTGGFPNPNSGDPYPQWYTKESAGIFPNATPATLTLDVTVLPEPGDYNADGLVNSLDYDEWVSTFGSAVGTPGTAADGAADGVIDAADYTVWRDALTAAAVVVPEPSAGVLTLGGAATIAFCAGTIAFTRPRRRQ